MHQLISNIRNLHNSLEPADNKAICWGSVAVILKPNNDLLLPSDILLLRRRGHKNDIYDGELCFPGGRVNKNQTYTQTAIRQTFQETGIKLTEDNLIFTLRKDYIALYTFQPNRKIQKALKTRTSIFFIEKQQPITLQTKQIDTYKWVPLETFVKKDLQNLGYQKILKHRYLFLDNLGIQPEKLKEIDQNFIQLLMPSIDVGMNRGLFGLTFYKVLFVISIMMMFLSDDIKDKILEGYQHVMEHAIKFESNFKQDYKHKQQAKQLVKKSYYTITTLWPSKNPKL